jgi:hypothetical protein
LQIFFERIRRRFIFLALAQTSRFEFNLQSRQSHAHPALCVMHLEGLLEILPDCLLGGESGFAALNQFSLLRLIEFLMIAPCRHASNSCSPP